MFCSFLSVNQLYSVHLLQANLFPCSTWFTLHKYTPVQLHIVETFSDHVTCVLLFTPSLSCQPAHVCFCLSCLLVYCFGSFVIKSFFTYCHAACLSAFRGPSLYHA
ncbi:hypothetical protein ATANTOWER_010768 [Ataeniobius toweri]|uniref:Secreted protein n=1 Tax=Ataeniobius toweri TaxID=208326 RepID=A0ABU7BS29_9TELE|nr:hypothetical protein [Ataeniobius toweri]